MADTFNTGKDVINVSGNLIEKDVLGILRKLQDYDPNLILLYLDDKHIDAGFSDAPWLIAERCPDGFLRKVFTVWELDDRIFERLHAADTRKSNVLFRIDEHNARIREGIIRRYKEEREEMKDVFSHLLNSPKTTYSFPNAEGNTVTVDDQFGVIKRECS